MCHLPGVGTPLTSHPPRPAILHHCDCVPFPLPLQGTDFGSCFNHAPATCHQPPTRLSALPTTYSPTHGSPRHHCRPALAYPLVILLPPNNAPRSAVSLLAALSALPPAPSAHPRASCEMLPTVPCLPSAVHAKHLCFVPPPPLSFSACQLRFIVFCCLSRTRTCSTHLPPPAHLRSTRFL